MRLNFLKHLDNDAILRFSSDSAWRIKYTVLIVLADVDVDVVSLAPASTAAVASFVAIVVASTGYSSDMTKLKKSKTVVIV